MSSRKTPKTIAEGEWLKDAMLKADVSNEWLAEKLGVEYANLVSNWRTGEVVMSDLAMLRAAQALKADPFVIRPSLLGYVDAIASESVLAGLPKPAIDQVLGFIGLLRVQHAAKGSIETVRLSPRPAPTRKKTKLTVVKDDTSKKK